MTTISANLAKTKLQKLLNNVAASHEPLHISGSSASGVLVSEEDWRSIQETLYLLAIPGMRESIQQGIKTPVSKVSISP